MHGFKCKFYGKNAHFVARCVNGPWFYIKWLHLIFTSDDYFLEIENKSHDIIALFFSLIFLGIGWHFIIMSILTYRSTYFIILQFNAQQPNKNDKRPARLQRKLLAICVKIKSLVSVFSALCAGWMGASVSDRIKMIRYTSKAKQFMLISVTQPIEQLWLINEIETDNKWYSERRRRRHNWDKL